MKNKVMCQTVTHLGEALNLIFGFPGPQAIHICMIAAPASSPSLFLGKVLFLSKCPGPVRPLC